MIDICLLLLILLYPFTIFSFCSSLITFNYIALLTHLDMIQFITYIPIQLYNYKFGHNTSLHKYYKVSPNEDTRVLKIDSVMFLYSTSIINAWHHHAFSRCRSLVHTDHFQVGLNLVYIGDSIDIVQLGKYWITCLPC